MGQLKLRANGFPILILGIPLIGLISCQKNTFQTNRENHRQHSVFARDHNKNKSTNRHPKKKPKCETTCLEYPSRLDIGGDYTHVNLKPHHHPSFRGNLGGLQGMYEYRPINQIYGAAKFSWKEGDTHGSSGKRSLLYIDIQERLGYSFGSREHDWLITLFSGFGYRHLGEKLRPKHDHSLHFRYNEFYFPIGFMSDYAVNCWFALGVNVTWMPQIYPTLRISSLNKARWKLTNTLNNLSIELPFDFTLTQSQRFHLTFSPFYEHWQDGHTTARTKTGSSFHVPGNTYHFWGADLNFGYAF
jgi:hypothetical protein